MTNCKRKAEFTITTRRLGAGIAGPDPYCDETHTCRGHVGELLGTQPTAAHPEACYWEVTPIVPDGAYCCVPTQGQQEADSIGPHAQAVQDAYMAGWTAHSTLAIYSPSAAFVAYLARLAQEKK